MLSLPCEPLGRYCILKLLGQGGMGAVYLAEDTSLGRKVALKIPSLDGPNADELIKRFQREARSAATLHHPNICPVYDVGEIDGKPYLTMRYIEGRPLTDRINRERPQNPRNVAVVVRKLALALAHAHERGVVHRDLKPANVMMGSKNEPIVMDFGLARQMGGANEKQVTQSGMIVGTPAYMSPQQISDDSTVIDHRTDIWSLGVMLFEMLTGRLPYDGSVLQIVGAIQHVEPPLASDIRPELPRAITLICRKMMTRDRDQRYQSMNDVAKDLAAFLKDAPTESLIAGDASADDGALPSMAVPGMGMESHAQTPRSLSAPLEAGDSPEVAEASSSMWRRDANPLATLMESIGRSTSALFSRRRRAGAKGGIRWAMPLAAAAGVLLLIGVIYATSGGTTWLAPPPQRVPAAASPPASVPPSTVGSDLKSVGLVNGDFSEGFEGWTLNEEPAGFRVFQPKPGQRAMTSFGTSAKDSVMGRLHQTFVVPDDADALEFHVHGSGRPETYVVLKEGDRTVHKENGPNRQVPLRIEWPLADLRGKTVVLEIVDYTQGTYGFIGAHGFRILKDSDDPAPAKRDDEKARIERLKQMLVGHVWNYVDSKHPPGGPVRFYPNGKFHDQWKWNYWVVGPKTMHVQFWDPEYHPSKPAVFSFDDELTSFTSEFDGHRVKGTRLEAIK